MISGSDESVDVSDIDNGNVYFDIILHSQGNLEKIKSLDLQTNSIANFNGDWNLHVKLWQKKMWLSTW